MTFALEGAPSSEQKNRLEDWLTELKIICRKYRILLDTEDMDTRIIDLDRSTIIGIGVQYLLAERAGRQRITGYEVTDSILDGVWPVDSPEGLVEQRSLGSIWPTHPTQEAS